MKLLGRSLLLSLLRNKFLQDIDFLLVSWPITLRIVKY